MGKSIIRNFLAGVKRKIRGIYSCLYILNDTCDTCTLDQYIKAVHEGKPNALLARGFAFRRTLRQAAVSLYEEYSRKIGNRQENMKNDLLVRIYRYRANIDTLSAAAVLCSVGKYDEALQFMRTNMNVAKKKPSDRKEQEALIKSIWSMAKAQKIKLSEAENNYNALLDTKVKADKSAREIFIENITAFKMCLELSTPIGLDMTLTEYIIYNRQYNEFVKRQTLKKHGKK